ETFRHLHDEEVAEVTEVAEVVEEWCIVKAVSQWKMVVSSFQKAFSSPESLIFRPCGEKIIEAMSTNLGKFLVAKPSNGLDSLFIQLQFRFFKTSIRPFFTEISDLRENDPFVFNHRYLSEK
ncbi:hypothetical protein PV325_007141, partial [Microctonus aethiopoides]